MDISKDTKALVAAQLTQAWASTADSGQNPTDIHRKYSEFLQLLDGFKPEVQKGSMVMGH